VRRQSLRAPWQPCPNIHRPSISERGKNREVGERRFFSCPGQCVFMFGVFGMARRRGRVGGGGVGVHVCKCGCHATPAPTTSTKEHPMHAHARVHAAMERTRSIYREHILSICLSIYRYQRGVCMERACA
jgi:hypothetical protein